MASGAEGDPRRGEIPLNPNAPISRMRASYRVESVVMRTQSLRWCWRLMLSTRPGVGVAKLERASQEMAGMIPRKTIEANIQNITFLANQGGQLRCPR
jgi:hypothetical protein